MHDMDIQSEIERIEDTLKDRGVPVSEFLGRVGVDASTWTRWRGGKFFPRFANWQAVQAELAKMEQDGEAA